MWFVHSAANACAVFFTIANVGTQRRRNSYLSLRTGPRYVASHSLQITRSLFVLLIKADTDCFRIVRARYYDLRGKRVFLWSWINYIRSNSCPCVWLPISIFLLIITTGKERLVAFICVLILNLLHFLHWTKGKKHVCSMNRHDFSFRSILEITHTKRHPHKLMCFGFQNCEHAVKETGTNSAQLFTISYLAYTVIKIQNQKLWLISRAPLNQRSEQSPQNGKGERSQSEAPPPPPIGLVNGTPVSLLQSDTLCS